MKKIVFILLFIPLFSHGQGCIVSTDPKTGKDVKAGVTFLIDSTGKPGGTIAFDKTFDKLVLDMTCMFTAKGDDKSNEKRILIVTFANGDIKKFKSTGTTKMSPVPDMILFGLNIDLDQSDGLYFSKTPIRSIRISNPTDETRGYDKQIDNITAQNIMKSVECVL